MKYLAQLCIIFLMLCAVSFAEGSRVVWTKTFGTLYNDNIYSVRTTPDGGFVIAGHIDQGEAARVYLVKTDCLGDIEWEVIADSVGCEGKCVEMAVDEGYVVVGKRVQAAGSRAFLMKFSLAGHLDWYRQYPYAGGDAAFIVQTTDNHHPGCYLIVGSAIPEGPWLITRAWAAIVQASNGTPVYQHFLESPNPTDNDYGLAGCEVGEPIPGFVITGKWSYPADFNIFLEKVNPFLVHNWVVGFGGNHEDEGRAIVEVGDGSLVVTGLYSDDLYAGRAWLVKRDYEGNLLWEKFIADPVYNFSIGRDLEVTSDSGFIVCGFRRLDGDLASADVYVVKTDADGNVQWYETVGGAYVDAGYSIDKAGDNAFVVAGVTRSSGAGSLEGYLIKFGDMLNDTEDPQALAHNGNRHLLREPNTEVLHLVYTRAAQIIYQYSADGGAVWSLPEIVGAGQFPAVALASDNLPSVAWTDAEGGLWYRRKTSATSWSGVYHLDDPASSGALHLNSPPAIAIDPVSRPNIVHILVTRSGLRPRQTYAHRLEDFSFPIDDPYQGSFELIEQKLGPMEPPLRIFPSIARCEVNNSLHAAWQRSDTICYAVKPRNGAWDNWGWQFDLAGLQSAHPFVETYGDSIFVVWQHLDPVTQKEDVYRARRYVTLPFEWWNFSWTSDLISLDPVNASGFFTVYVEEPTIDSPFDIYYKVRAFDDRIHVSNTPGHSRYPQSVARFTAEADFHYTAWLEGDEAPYEIRFRKMQHLTPPDMAYLSSPNGQSVASPYLVARDGFIDDWQIPVDIGNATITYRFPLLPGYAYKAKAVVYHEGTGSWSGRLKCDNNLLSTVTYNANVPETLECWIPPALYADSVLTISFERIAGTFAAVGPIYIYRYEYESGGGPMAQDGQLVGNTSVTVFPNPFTEKLNITYQTPAPSRSDMKLYDVTGRLVKQFSLPPDASFNHVVWDGLDDQGRAVPSGVYFLRIDSPDSGAKLGRKVLRVQ